MYRAALVLICLIFAVEASNVLEFTDSNFEDRVKEHEIILVEFYAPWCGHCKKLAPEYERAADRLLAYDPPVPLAKVDCTAEKATCDEFGVSGYPALKIFKGGVFDKDYPGPRDADGIVTTMAKESGGTLKELHDVKGLEDFLARDGGCVVGFFKKSGSKLAKTLQKVADTYGGLRFAHTTASAVLTHTGYQDDIVLFRPKVMTNKFEDTAVRYGGGASKDTLQIFLDQHRFGLCPHRTPGNADKFQNPIFIAFYDVDYVQNPKVTNYWRNRVLKVASKLRNEGIIANFAVSNKDEHKHEVDSCGLGESFGETPVVCAYDDRERRFRMEEEFSVDTFEKFVRNVLKEKIDPYIRSQPIPKNDQPLKIAVTKNFDELVNDPTKDVLIEFFAPWCGHCKELAPKYEELAEMLKDEPDIVIAKMDATANDTPHPYMVTGFPTIYFAPKHSKDSPRKYEGEHELDALLKYLARRSTKEMENFDRDGNVKGMKEKTEL